MKPYSKLFISSDGITGSFGDGKWRLLDGIKRYGSIQKAAQELGRGYRKAWGDIKRAEEALGQPLVKKNRGGISGGSTELTEFGIKLLENWKKYKAEVGAFMIKSYDRHLKKLLKEYCT